MIPHVEALNFFLALIASLPGPVRSLMVWALGLAGLWTFLYVLLNNT